MREMRREEVLPPAITMGEILIRIERRYAEDAPRSTMQDPEFAAQQNRRKERRASKPTDGIWLVVEGFEAETMALLDAHVRNIESLRESVLYQSIPAEIQDRIRDLRVTNVGIGGGPSSVAQRHHAFPEPVRLWEALSWIESHPSHRQAYVEFEGGFSIVFDSVGFHGVRER